MVALGQQTGSGFGAGFAQAAQNRFAPPSSSEKRAEEAAKQKRLKENIGHLIKVADVWQFTQEEFADIDAPAVKKRMTDELTMLFLDLGGGKIGPRTKAIIGSWVNMEVGDAKAMIAGFKDSAARGENGFNIGTLVNISNSNKPRAVEAYMETTVKRNLREAKVKKAESEAQLADARTMQINRKLEQNKFFMSEIKNMFAEKKEGVEMSGADRQLGMSKLLSFINPQASRALTQIVNAQRLQPGGIVRTEIAKATGEALGEKAKPIKNWIARWLDVSFDSTRNSLAKMDPPITIPSPKVIEALQTKEEAFLKVFDQMERLLVRVTNKPELLSAPGFVARSFKGLASGIQGFANLIGVSRFVEPSGVRKLLEDIPVLGDLGRTAEESAIVRSQVVDLTFKLAALAGQTGRALSDKDYEIISKQLGAATADPAMMIGVMRSIAMVGSSAFNIEFKSRTGKTKFIGLPDSRLAEPFADMKPSELKGVVLPLLNDTQLDNYMRALESKGATTE
jgi:hypothetical protein